MGEAGGQEASCSPQGKQSERQSSAKTPQPAKTDRQGGTKRKLGSSGTNSEDEGEKRPATSSTPKRRRSQAGEGSPTPGPATPRTPNAMQRHAMPISERQQMSLLKQMTAEESQGESSPRPSSPDAPGSSVKKTPTAKVNKRNERGETRLHIAAIKGDDKETKRLIKAGADVNVEDYAGWTPLHEACNRGWVAVAKQLLKAGAIVNVQGMDNDTPLHDASSNGHYKLVQMLLRHGANPLQMNSKGKTPLDSALNDEIRDLLKNEIIASTSSSSSQDDVRSPTSPESALLSDKEDDHKHESQESRMATSPGSAASCKGDNVTSSTGSPHPSLMAASSLAVSSSISHSMLGCAQLRPLGKHTVTGSGNGAGKALLKDLSVDTPRLMLKFHKESSHSTIEHQQRSKGGHYIPYSVTLKTNEEESQGPYSPQFSESSQDSDLYNTQLGLSYIDKKLADSDSKVDSSVSALAKGIAESFKSSAVDSTSQDSIESRSGTGWSSVASSSTQPVITAASTAPSSSIAESSRKRQNEVGSSSIISEPMEVDSAISSSSNSAMAIQNTSPAPISNIPTTSSTSPSSSTSSHPSSALRRPPGTGLLSKIIDSSSSSSSGSILHHHHQKDHVSSEEEAKRAEIQKSKESQAMHVYAFDDEDDDSMVGREFKISPKFEREKDKDKDTDKDKDRDKDVESTKQSPKSEKDCLRLSPKSERESRSPKADRSSPKSENRIFVSKGERQLQTRLEKEARHDRTSPKSDRDPKASPPKVDKEHRHSPKLEKEVKAATKVVDANRASPKPDRDSRSPKSDSSRESRPSSPKVPPLRIILPTKPNNGNHDQEKQKSTVGKHALPYVLNPTQEGEASSTVEMGEGEVDGSQMAPTSTDPEGATTTGISSTSTPGSTNIVAPSANNTSNEAVAGPTNSPTASQAPSSSTVPGTAVTSSHSASSSPTPCTSTVPQDSIARRTRNKERESEREREKEKEKEVVDRDDGDSRHSSTDGKKDGDEQQGERRMTRSQFRTQQQQHKGDHTDLPPEKEAPGNNGSNSSGSGSNSNSNRQEQDYSHMHPRTRKLRRTEPPPMPLPPQHQEKPDNPYQMYLNIRRKVASRWQHWEVVQPKAPQGFKDYLLVNANYVLEGNSASRLAAPMLSPPNSVTGPMRDLFIEHEKRRYKLRLQHVIEREKLMLSIEQEILRVHGRAARALANQGTPLSFCTILKDENIYTPVEGDQDEKEKNTRTRYNGRQFLSWLQDVGDKFEKIKEALLLRHHHEAESLHAVQKLEWEWKLKESGLCDYKLTPVIDDIHVPMVQVNDEFDLLPA